MKNRWPILFLILLGLTACKPAEVIPYEQLLSGLTNLNAIARLDVPATEMICSYDRTGANEDYNHFQGKTEDGQCILADLKGPGVVTRFWFTGINPDKKIRFYFDGEKMPSFEFSWNDLRRGIPPFNIEPLSMDEQNCWYSFVPVPFKKQLLITTDDAGYQYGRAPKMYYQINWNPLASGLTVESLNPEDDFTPLQVAARVWDIESFGALPEPDTPFSISAGETVSLWSRQGAASVEAFTIQSGMHDPEVLRNVLLHIYWDENEEPSVSVPLGDFFGSVWRRWRAQSSMFGSVGNTFFSRFPMPFQKSARFMVENRSARSVDLKFGIREAAVIDGGYFHSGWVHSGADRTGEPHAVLNVNGKGRYAGCILSQVSFDKSFWALESDESMYVDGRKTWQGTGLEDYFNSGWYYGNVFARPMQGLPVKAPFRTVQYRLHLTEPVLFDKRFEVQFERGPNNASHAAYESISFYYLDRPQAAFSHLENRSRPMDPVRQHTLMTDLWNYERFGDLQGEIEYIERYTNDFKPPFADVLKQRALACRYELGAASVEALADAPELKTLYTQPDAALVQLYCNMTSELYLDGEKILVADKSAQPVSKLLTLKKGRHVLAVASVWQQYPRWTQVAVRNADGYLTGTSTHWKHAINPAGNWASLEYDDSQWAPLKNYSGRVKGPPEEPYIWVNPDPFVNTLSQASGLRPSEPWSNRQGYVVYRHVFEVE